MLRGAWTVVDCGLVRADSCMWCSCQTMVPAEQLLRDYGIVMPLEQHHAQLQVTHIHPTASVDLIAPLI